MLVARKIMPWYDERFRGYGWDKVHCRPCLWPSKGLTPGNRSLSLGAVAADNHLAAQRHGRVRPARILAESSLLKPVGLMITGQDAFSSAKARMLGAVSDV